MDDLPLELLSMIIEQLWEDSEDPPDRGPRLTHPRTRSKDKLLLNLRNIRLVCKSFCHAAASLFGETFFQVRWVSSSTSSLRDLIAVSKLPQYVRHVHSLRISGVDFDPTLYSQGEATQLLATAFTNLSSNLTSILMSLKSSHNSQSCQIEADIFSAVQSALVQSTAQLKRLRIYTNKPSILALPTLSVQSLHAASLQYLTCLKLDFLHSTPLSPSIHEALSQCIIASFVTSIPNLERLSLYFASEIWYRAPLAKLVGHATIENLKFLRICGFNCRESELTTFLERHKDTLESLELADFKLRNGRWREVFNIIIEKNTRIERIMFRRVWDREEIFELDDFGQGMTRTKFESMDCDSVAVSLPDAGLDLEPAFELGTTGTYMHIPADMLWDEDEVEDGDGEGEVDVIPYFANELLHPGMERQGDGMRDEEGSTEKEGSEEEDSGKSETDGESREEETSRSSSVVADERVGDRSVGMADSCVQRGGEGRDLLELSMDG